MCKSNKIGILLLIVFSFYEFNLPVASGQTTESYVGNCSDWSSVEEITCDQLSCCWSTFNSTAVTCFNATNITTTTVMPTTTTILPTTTTIMPTTTTIMPTTTTIMPTTTTVLPTTTTIMPTTTTVLPTTTTIVYTTTLVPATSSSPAATTGVTVKTVIPGGGYASVATATVSPTPVATNVRQSSVSTNTRISPVATNTGLPPITTIAGVTVSTSSNNRLSPVATNSRLSPVATATGQSPVTTATGLLPVATTIGAPVATITGSPATATIAAMVHGAFSSTSNVGTASNVGTPASNVAGGPYSFLYSSSQNEAISTTPYWTTFGATVCQPTASGPTSEFMVADGTKYPQYQTNASCLNACYYEIANCVAANIMINKNDSIICVLHTNLNDLDELFDSPQALLYIIINACPTTTTVTPPAAQTQVASCTALVWANSTGTCCIDLGSYPQYTTVDDCLNACACLVTGCIAAFVRNSTAAGDNGPIQLQCFMNTNKNALINAWSCPYVTQYVIIPPGADTTTGAPSTAESGLTTASISSDNLVDYSICWHPPPAPNTQTTIHIDQYGLTATYMCNVGYKFIAGGTSRTIVCDGVVWTPVMDGCAAITCDTNQHNAEPVYDSAPMTIDAGQTLMSDCDSLTTGMSAMTFVPGPTSGNHGRFIDGSVLESVKCTSVNGKFGQLEQPMTGCQAGRCLVPPLVTNTTASLNGNIYTLYLNCIPGHRFPNGQISMQFICNSDGTWPPMYPCAAIFCSDLSPLTNGQYSTDDVIYDTIVDATCDAGFIFPNHILSIIIQCIEVTEMNGVEAVWNNTIPTACQAVICTNPPMPVSGECTWSEAGNMNVATTLFPYLFAILYQCTGNLKFIDGYTSENVTCDADEFWSTNDVSCAANRCNPVPSVLYATPDSRNASMGSVIVYTCQFGYWFSRNVTQATTVCNGISWSPTATACTVVTCPALNISNANLNTTDNFYLSTVDIQCNEGYKANGSSSVTVNCTVDGMWSADYSCQPVNCGPAPEVSNADIEQSTYRQTFPTNITYACLAGYWFARNIPTLTTTCSASAQWTVYAEPGVSLSQGCTAITCIPLVVYTVNTTNVGIGTVANVTCPPGQRFTNSKSTEMVTTCNSAGSWIPNVPSFTYIVPLTRVILPTVEASNSGLIAGIAIAFMVAGTVLLLFFDSTRIFESFKTFVKRVKCICNYKIQ